MIMANTLLVGGHDRSTADRDGPGHLARAKIGATSSTVNRRRRLAGYGIVSTWVATEFELFAIRYPDASHYGQSADGTPPIRVFRISYFAKYPVSGSTPWFSLWPMVSSSLERGLCDFGPMRGRGERDSGLDEKHPGRRVSESNEAVLESKSALGDVVEALLPIVVCLTAVLVTLVVPAVRCCAEIQPCVSRTLRPSIEVGSAR